MSDDAPMSAAERRPNDEPYYRDSQCECGTDYVYYDAHVEGKDLDDEDFWYDEFICPDCEYGLLLDTPEDIELGVNYHMADFNDT